MKIFATALIYGTIWHFGAVMLHYLVAGNIKWTPFLGDMQNNSDISMHAIIFIAEVATIYLALKMREFRRTKYKI
jgi:hypothetical protein